MAARRPVEPVVPGSNPGRGPMRVSPPLQPLLRASFLSQCLLSGKLRRAVLTRSDIEKKVKAMFKGFDTLDVQLEGGKVRISLSGVGESPNELFTKLGDLVSALSKVEGLSNIDVIVSMEGSAYGVEVEIY